MNLLTRIYRYIIRNNRRLFYRSLSTVKISCPSGAPIFMAPVLSEGRGRIFVGAGTSFGYPEDQDFWNSYVFLNPRAKESEIRFGNHCQICNHFTAIAEGPGIEMGNGVLVGSHVAIYDTDFYEISANRRLNGTPKMGKVVIEDNVWIGDRVTILKGAHIGKNSVVAAGAVVAGKFPDDVVIGGVPARVIRSL